MAEESLSEKAGNALIDAYKKRMLKTKHIPSPNRDPTWPEKGQYIWKKLGKGGIDHHLSRIR